MSFSYSNHVLSKIVSETLETGCSLPYGNLNESDISWATEKWTSFSFQPEILFKGLVLANRTIRVSKFALVFNYKLQTAIISRDSLTLRNVLEKPSLPEIDENKHLTSEEIKLLNDNISREVAALNLIYEQNLGNIGPSSISVSEDKIINTENHSDCYKDVCLVQIGNTIAMKKESVNFISSNRKDAPIFVAEKIDSKVSTYVWCFNLLDLVRCITSNGINPHTSQSFNQKTLLLLKETYRVEISMYTCGMNCLNQI